MPAAGRSDLGRTAPSHTNPLAGIRHGREPPECKRPRCAPGSSPGGGPVERDDSSPPRGPSPGPGRGPRATAKAPGSWRWRPRRRPFDPGDPQRACVEPGSWPREADRGREFSRPLRVPVGRGGANYSSWPPLCRFVGGSTGSGGNVAEGSRLVATDAMREVSRAR